MYGQELYPKYLAHTLKDIILYEADVSTAIKCISLCFGNTPLDMGVGMSMAIYEQFTWVLLEKKNICGPFTEMV